MAVESAFRSFLRETGTDPEDFWQEFDPPRPPKPNQLWHLGKIVFNKTYWHTVPKGRV